MSCSPSDFPPSQPLGRWIVGLAIGANLNRLALVLDYVIAVLSDESQGILARDDEEHVLHGDALITGVYHHAALIRQDETSAAERQEVELQGIGDLARQSICFLKPLVFLSPIMIPLNL